MVILTSYTANTYKAQIRSSLEKGFKQLYTASCTMGEEQAAQAVVAKWFSKAAADSVRQVKDAAEIASLIGDFCREPQRKQIFSVWTFNSTAKDPAPATPAAVEVTTDSPAGIEGEDPRWQAVRETMLRLKDIGRSYLEGQAWLGWQLACLKKDHGCKHGGARNQVADSATWPKLVAEKTGLSRRTADVFIQLFEASKAKLQRTKGAAAKDAKAALAIFTGGNPLALPPEQRDHLRDVIASLCDGETQGTMLAELGVIARPAAPKQSASKTPPAEVTAGQLAFHFFENLQNELLHLRSSADFDKLVIALPLHPDEDHPVALSTIETDLRAVLEKVEAAKASHAKPAKGKG